MKQQRIQVEFGKRLRHINQRTLIISLAFVIVIFIGTNFVTNLINRIDTNRAQVEVMADLAGASLLFNDSRSAQDLLRSLRHTPELHSAYIYDKEGVLFAQYSNSPCAAGESRSVHAQQADYALGIREIALSAPILHEEQYLGNVRFEVKLGGLYLLLLMQIAITLSAGVIALWIGRKLLAQFSQSVLNPLSELTGVMNKVSEMSDYRVRANSSGIAELDILSDGFNNILEQIQERDDELELHREYLEQQVAARTMQLQLAKKPSRSRQSGEE